MTHREHVEEMVKIALFEHVGLLTKEAMTGNIARSVGATIRTAANATRPAQSVRKGWLQRMFAPKQELAVKPRLRYDVSGVPGRGYSTTSHLRGATA